MRQAWPWLLWDLGFKALGLGFIGLWFGFRVLGLGFGGFGFRVYPLVRLQGFGFGDQWFRTV